VLFQQVFVALLFFFDGVGVVALPREEFLEAFLGVAGYVQAHGVQ
jgi:hypothetical protein